MSRSVMSGSVMSGSAIAAHIAIHVAVRIGAARLRIVAETAVLVAFTALVLRMLMTTVRCGVTAEVAAVAIAATKTAAIAVAASVTAASLS